MVDSVVDADNIAGESDDDAVAGVGDDEDGVVREGDDGDRGAASPAAAVVATVRE